MKQKSLGRTELTISPFALGCVTFGREIDEESSYRVMDYAVEKGITFFDTAEGYGGGQARAGRKDTLGIDDIRERTGEMSSSERIIGSWMRSRGCRDQVTICTKISGGHGKPEEIEAYELSDAIEVVWLEDGDHSFKPRKASGRTLEQNVAEAIAAITVFVGSLA